MNHQFLAVLKKASKTNKTVLRKKKPKKSISKSPKSAKISGEKKIVKNAKFRFRIRKSGTERGGHVRLRPAVWATQF
jgi:hypothetical protein